jgi:hypothetical protein
MTRPAISLLAFGRAECGQLRREAPKLEVARWEPNNPKQVPSRQIK